MTVNNDEQTLATASATEIEVPSNVTEGKTKIGTAGFCKALHKELMEGEKAWRSSGALADFFGVDPHSLEEWMDGRCCNIDIDQKEIRKDVVNPTGIFICKSGKEDGKFYYSLIARNEKDKEKEKKEKDNKDNKEKEDKEDKEENKENNKKKVKSEPTVSQEDRYYVAQLNLICHAYGDVLKRYHHSIALRSEEASSLLTQSFKRLRASVAILESETKANPNKLLDM